MYSKGCTFSATPRNGKVDGRGYMEFRWKEKRKGKESAFSSFPMSVHDIEFSCLLGPAHMIIPKTSPDAFP